VRSTAWGLVACAAEYPPASRTATTSIVMDQCLVNGNELLAFGA
jgi:hypothetical protein